MSQIQAETLQFEATANNTISYSSNTIIVKTPGSFTVEVDSNNVAVANSSSLTLGNTIISNSDITVDDIIADTLTVGGNSVGGNLAKTDVAQNFTAAQGSDIVTLTDAASITTNTADSNIFKVTLSGNRTLSNPTLVAGRTYTWIIIQDGTGNRTLGYGSRFLWPGGTAPTLSTGANDIDMFTGLAISTTQVLCSMSLDYD